GCTGAGAPSPLRFSAAGQGSGSDQPVRRLIALRRRPRSRAAPLRTAGSPRAAAVLGRGDTERPQPAQVQGGAGGVPLVAHLRHAAENELTKPIACLISACRRKTCRTRAGRIARRGGGGAVAAPMRRRGRRPIEAPGSAAPNRSGDGAPAS